MKPGIHPVIRRAAAGLFGVGAYIAVGNLHSAGSAHLVARRAAHSAAGARSVQHQKNVSPSSFGRLNEQIQRLPYRVEPDTKQPGDLVARNPATGLSGRYTRAGASLSIKDGTALTLRTVSVNGQAVAPVTPESSDLDRLEYRHDGYREWYANGRQGLEQGWTFDHPVQGKSDLEVELAYSGLDPKPQGAGVRFRDSRGQPALDYGAPSAVDAAGRKLPARLTVEGKRLLLRVAAADARYPVTIDPNITAAIPLKSADTAAGGQFGQSVAASGGTVVVSEPGFSNSSGEVFVFEQNQGGASNWGLVKQLLPSTPIPRGRFGLSASGKGVAIQGDIIVVASTGHGDNGSGSYDGAAYVFGRNRGGTENWGQTTMLTELAPAVAADNYASAISISNNEIAVAANNAKGEGSVFIYIASSSGSASPFPFFTIPGPTPNGGDRFGVISISNDEFLAVGAPGSSPTAKGYVNLYRPTTPGNPWALTAQFQGTATGSSFGAATALSSNDVNYNCREILVIGAPASGSNGSGAAYAYGLGAGSSSCAVTQTFNSNGVGAHFGAQVAVGGDVIAVGAPGAAGGGSVELYMIEEAGALTGWGPLMQLGDPVGNSNDAFGAAVSLVDDTLVVGASGSGATQQGAAYVYGVLPESTYVSAQAGVDSVTVSWEPTFVDPVTGWNVYESVNGGPMVEVASLNNPNSYSYAVTGLSPLDSYRFEVAAVDSYGAGSLSSASGAVTPLPGTTNIVVTSLADNATAGDKLCTLREAINNTQFPGVDTTQGDCATGATAGNFDKITFSLSGTISVGSNLPSIGSGNVTIDGSGQQVVLNGGGGVTTILHASGGSLSLNALSLTHGGAVFFGSGGALAVSGAATVAITRSTLSYNSAYYGGAVYMSGGSLTVANSTIYGNSGDFGVIAGPAGSVAIVNSTIAHNTAGLGGVLQIQGSMTNTLLANNTGSDGRAWSCYSSFTDGGGNISDDNTCGFTSKAPDTPSYNNTSAGLDPAGLQNNGGPTDTVGVVAGSPAINAGNNAACAASPVKGVDQRGVTRPILSHCTIGALEYFPAPTLTGTAGNGSAALSWQASSGATGYDIYQVGAGGSLSLVVSGVTTTSYTVTGLSNGTAYEYVVVAVDGSSLSGDSNIVSVTPGTTPAPFSFNSVTGAAPGSTVASNTITLSSLQAAAPISIDIGYFCINGGACSNIATTVQPGATVSLRLNALKTAGASATANLVIGGVTGTFTVTTQ